MKKTTLWIFMSCLTLLPAQVAIAADVNCDQVRKYLKMGRDTDFIAETMVISEDQVKKCQAEGERPVGGTPAPEKKAPEEPKK